MPSPDVNIEYLLVSSRNLLMTLELSRLNNAANIRKEMIVLFDKLVEEMATALVARWFLEHGEELRRMVHSSWQAELFPADEGLTSRYEVLRCPSNHSSLSSIK